MDFGNFQLKQALDQAGMCSGNNDLGALADVADFNDIDLNAVALAEDFAADHFLCAQQSLGLVSGTGDLDAGVAIACIDTCDGRCEDLVLLGSKLFYDHAALSFADTLDDDLLCGLGSDTAEVCDLDLDADLIAQLRICGILHSVLDGDLAGGVIVVLNDGLYGVHGNGAGVLVDVDEQVIQSGALGCGLVHGLVGCCQGLRNSVEHISLLDALFLLQVLKRFDHLGVHESFFSF